MLHLCVGKDKKKLTINLKNPMFVSNQTGEKIILQFDSSLEIMDAAAKVYGANKCEVRLNLSCLFFCT